MKISAKQKNIKKYLPILLGAVLLSTSIFLVLKLIEVRALAKFDPGNIISDAVMRDTSTMNKDQIQNFLLSKNPCNNTKIHLANSYPNMKYNIRNGKFVCMAEESFNGESAADIIWQASRDYQINPQVLIVLLEKEQGLITDSWPNNIQYRSATGYGCPDTAACDSKYYGLKNQVRMAAALFDNVLKGGWSNYPIGDNYIQYNPNANCGGSIVNIKNRATSALYRYTPYQPNKSAISAGWGQGDQCGAYGNRNFWLFFTTWFGETQDSTIYLRSDAYVKSLEWTDKINNSGIIGTYGQSLQMEAFRIYGDVEYSSYNDLSGWQPYVKSGMISGTTSINQPIRAIKIKPISTISSKFDLWYRAHISNIGWMGWVKNGEPAGIIGEKANNIESIEIKLLPKSSSPDDYNQDNAGYMDKALTIPQNNLYIESQSHISYIGWTPTLLSDMTIGTTNRSLTIEALKLNLINHTGIPGGIIYSSHIQNIGWQSPQKNNSESGTTGKGLRIESLRIALTGELKNHFDVWYRSHIQNIGWQEWTKNGSPTGSVGSSLRMESLEIHIIPKNTIPPFPINSNKSSFFNPGKQKVSDIDIQYSTHQSGMGWVQDGYLDGVAGTTGQSRSLESIKLDAINSVAADGIGISCSALTNKSSSWIETKSISEVCGTTGQSNPLRNIKLALTGAGSDKYDIYYRVHVAYKGWLDWKKNSELAADENSTNNIEAISIKIEPKK
ncbi:MAG: hypothetical protein WAV68_01375 [Candidatus Nanogingivalis sp.]